MHADKAKAVKLHGELRDTAGEGGKHRREAPPTNCPPCSTLLVPTAQTHPARSGR